MVRKNPALFMMVTFLFKKHIDIILQYVILVKMCQFITIYK